MNILIITAVSGFLPKFLMQDVKLLQERGHTVYYATNFGNPIYQCSRKKLEGMGIQCYPIAIAKSPVAFCRNVKALIQLAGIVNTENIGAVYLHNPMGGVLGRILTFPRKNIQVIYTAHGFHFYKGASFVNWVLYYPVERYLAHRTDQLITINTEDKKLADQFTLQNGGRVVKIPGIGVDTQRFRPAKGMRDRIREKYAVGPEHFVFLSVGELNRNKNHITVIKAFATLRNPQAILFICGEGPKHRELQKQIHGLGLDGRVVLWGYQTRIEEFYQIADVFLFPSIREGLGMAAIEAMATGLPLIVSDNRGTREYARDNALTCKVGDVDAFAKAMQQVMLDKEKRSAMSKRSIEIAKNFTREKTMEVMEDVLKRLEDG